MNETCRLFLQLIRSCFSYKDENGKNYSTKLFNIIFTVSGFIFICLGIWLIFVLAKLDNISVEASTSLPWVIIAFGVCFIVMGFIASLLQRSLMYMFMYSSCLFVIFVFELLLGILIYGYHLESKNGFKKGIEYHMKNYMRDRDKIMDVLQILLECCGNSNPSDWLSTPFGQITSSCCKTRFCDPSNIEEIYNMGCYSRILIYLGRPTLIAMITVFVCSLLPLLGSCIIFFTTYTEITQYEKISEENVNLKELS